MSQSSRALTFTSPAQVVPLPSLTPDDVYVLTMSHKMNVLSSDFMEQLDAAYDFMD